MKFTEISENITRYARSTKTPNTPGLSPWAIALIMPLAWERGRMLMTSLNPIGIWSVEKKVLHKNDMGIIIYEVNLGASV